MSKPGGQLVVVAALGISFAGVVIPGEMLAQASRPHCDGMPEACQEVFRLGPNDVEPRLRNPEAVRRRLDSLYVDSLKARGVGGSVGLSLLIDAAGEVRVACVFETSGYRAIDDIALRLTRSMEFVPAGYRGEAVAAWHAQALTFSYTMLLPPQGVPRRDRMEPLAPCPTPEEYRRRDELDSSTVGLGHMSGR